MGSEKVDSSDSLELNQVPDVWEKKTLGELITFQRGYDLPIRNIIQGEWPVVTSQGIVGFHISYRANGPGIVLGRSGTLGEPKFINFKHYWPHNTTLFSKEFHNCDPKFAFYILKSLTLKTYNSGSAVPSLNRNYIHLISLAVPQNLKEQKAIAKILSDLDSKIELNQKMNKTLEAIAQAIFKHWFIDFEFPNEEGKPYKSSGGEMVDSELGDIPKGWEVRKLADLMYLEKGLSYKGKFLSESGIPLINLGCISPKGGFINEGIKYYIGDFSKRHTVEVGDILIANTDITQKREILGSPMIVPDNLDMKSTILFTHHLYAVRFLDSINTKNKEFVYCLMKTRNYGDYVKTYATGTTVLAIPKEAVHNFKFAYPNEVLMNYFSDLSKNIINKMQRNQNFNNLLSAVRDSILPKLMSGKIRVPLEE